MKEERAGARSSVGGWERPGETALGAEAKEAQPEFLGGPHGPSP